MGKDDVRVQALTTGSVDLAEYIPWQEVKALEKDPQIKVHVGYDTFNVIRMNPKRPPFDNVKVRQALNYLVDRKEIIDLAWGGIGRPFGAGLIPEGHWAFPRALQGTWSHDPAKGQRLLAEAGREPRRDADRLRLDHAVGPHGLGPDHRDPAPEGRVHPDRAEADGRPDPAAEAGVRRVPAHDGRVQPALARPRLLHRLLRHRRRLVRARGGVQRRGAGQAARRGPERRDQAKRAAVYAQVEQRVVELAPWVFLHWRPQAEAHRATVGGYTRLPGALGNKSLGGLKYVYREG